jgi:hypothetical protein
LSGQICGLEAHCFNNVFNIQQVRQLPTAAPPLLLLHELS